MNRLIHVDWSPRECGVENEQNCIFLEQPDGVELTLPEIADHIVGVIEHNPDDCRIYL